MFLLTSFTGATVKSWLMMVESTSEGTTAAQAVSRQPHLHTPERQFLCREEVYTYACGFTIVLTAS